MQSQVPYLEGVHKKRIIEIELSDRCDLYCIGCFTNRGRQSYTDLERIGCHNPKLLTLNEIDGILKKASNLGYTSALSSGHGEPTADRERFWGFIEIANRYSMTPVIASHCYWVTEEDAIRLHKNNVSLLSKLWSLKKAKTQVWIRDPKDRPFVPYKGAELPIGLKNLIDVYTNPSFIKECGYRLALNTVVSAYTKDELLEILEWDRCNLILPYFEFIFSSGLARKDPKLWLDGQAGETLYKEPFTERIMRAELAQSVVKRDQEMGYFYSVPIIPTGKLGQNTFDNTETVIINPYGYVVSCPAKADFMRDMDGDLLDARTSLEEILEKYTKCGSCTLGNYSCDADRFDRLFRRIT